LGYLFLPADLVLLHKSYPQCKSELDLKNLIRSMNSDYGLLTLPQHFHSKSEAEETKTQRIEFVEAGEDAPVGFESSEEPLDFIAPPVQGSVIRPRLSPVSFRRHNRHHAEGARQDPRLVVLVSPVHQQGQAFRHRPDILKGRAALRGIMCVARRKPEVYGRSSIRGNQMNLGVPAAAALTDRLRPVFSARRSRPDAP